MADGYWNRQNQLHPLGGLLKRPRTEYDVSPMGIPPAHEMHPYLPRGEERIRPRVVADPKSIGSDYDRYPPNAQFPSPASREGGHYRDVGLVRAFGGEIPTYSLADPMVRPGTDPRDLLPDGNAMARPGRDILPLPRDATSTLYVEGLPTNSTKREIAHIFRPFVGYKEVRLVSKESKAHREPLVYCFVEFETPACAATALNAIQGYKMDEHDHDSAYLRVQFSKHPGPRGGGGSGKRGRR